LRLLVGDVFFDADYRKPRRQVCTTHVSFAGPYIATLRHEEAIASSIVI